MTMTTGTTNTGGPAFPSKFEIQGGSFDPIKGRTVPAGNTEVYIELGMSLRDYFAAKALQALLGDQSVTELDINGYAEWSYKYADAMLRARQQPATTN